MKLSKRFLSLSLCLVLLIGCMPIFTAQASLEKPTRMDVVIAHVTEGDYKAYFPDIVNVPASVCGNEAPNGKLLVAYYKNTLHAPSKASEVKSSSIQIVESLDNGLTWSAPKTFIDNNKLIEWGFATEDNPVEMRDPNFALLNDGTIVFTAWTRRYTSDNFLKVYALTSHDGGKTWSEPVLIPVQTELGFQAKRGDIAVYDDGQMLIPIYGSNNRAVSVLGKYAKETGWEWIAEYPYPTVEGQILSEVSFVAAGETTYAMDRESGRVWQSEDRGQNWVQIADEPGSIHQPGLKLLPDGTIFATWAVKNEMGRPVYAKRFYPELGWDATPTQLVFRTNEYSADIADPSGVLLNDGRLFVVYYETISKTIGGTFCEIGDFDVTELATDTRKTIVFADDFDDENYVDGAVYTNTTYFNNNLNTDATGSIATTEKEEDNGYLHIFNNHQATSKYPQIRTTKYIKGDYSVSFDFRFEKSLPVNATSGALQDIDVYTNNADGVRYRIRNSIVNGESVFNLYFSKKDVDLYSPIKLDIKPGEWYKVRYTRIKNMYYFKLWQGDKEPTAWTAKFTSEEYTDNGPLRITWLSLKTNTIGGSYVDFDNLRISRNIDMDVLDEVYAIVGVKVPLTVKFSPAQTSPSVTWSSSNTAVATVDANGVVTPLSIGETVITSKYLDISAETKVVVTADGGFSWDFEDVEIGRRPTGLGDWTNADDCHARVYLDGDRKVMRFLDRNPSKNLISIKEFDPADTVYLTFDYKFVHAGYDTETGVRSGINSFGLLNTSYYSRFGKVYFSVFENEPGVGSLMYQTLEYTPGNTANVWTDTGIKLNANQWYNFKVEMVTGSDTVKITVDNQTVEMPVYGNDTVVDRVFFTADSASKYEEFMIDNFVLRTNVLPETYSLTFAGGEGAEGSAPVIAAGTAGEKIILPSNSFTKKQYEFGGWMLSGTNKIYKAGETFTMPASDVLFTAYWKFGNADGGFAYNFEGQSEGESPIGWKNNVNRDTLHGRIYNDNGNFVLRIVDNDSATINMERAFDESTTTRVSFNYKNVSFGTGDDLFGFYNGAFSGGSPVIRLGVFDNDDGTAVVKYYKGGWKATGITGIVSGKWYDVSLELVEGSTNATIIFGDQIATVPFEGASTAVTNLWFGSGGGGPTGEVFCVDDLKLETRVTKQSFAVTYSGGEGVTGNAPTQEATEEGTTFVLPSNKFTKTNYEFVGWVYNNKIYKAGENFKMPREAVNFTALWQYARFNGEYSENFESTVVGRVPSGWSSNVSSNATLGNTVYLDGENKVAQIVDKTSGALYFYKEFGNANTSRVSFKYKQTSFGEHGNMLSLFENDFWAGYADGSLRKIRLKVKSDGTGKGTLYNYLASAGYDYAPTHITGIELDKWYDVSIEIVEGSNTATIIFGDNVLTMPIYGTGTATSTLVLSSGENGANECEFFVDDVKILTRVPKDFFSVTYAGGDGAVGTAPTQETTEEGTTFTLPENTFTKTNYKFGGWVIGNTLYQPGETYTMPGQAVTFTAYWMLDTYNGGFEDKFDNLTAGYVPSSVGWGSNSGSNDNYYGRVYSVDNGNVLRMHDNDTAVSYNLGKEFEGSSNARLSFKYRQVSFGATGNEIALFEGFYAGLSNGNYKKVRLKVAPDGNGTGTLKYFDSVSTWDFKASEITGIELDKWYDVSIEVTEGSSTATVIFDNKIITVPVRNNSFVSTVALNTGNTADTCTFDLDDIKVETLLPRESFAVTYAGGEGATGTAPVQEDAEEGMSFVLPENTFVKQGYKFAGWLYGTDTLYKPGENFKMPNAAVTFTAYWQINTYTGGFTETFEDKTEGTTPGTGWWNNSNTDLLHGRVYLDSGNKVLKILDESTSTINTTREFEKSSSSRVSFKYKNISFGTGSDLFGLYDGPYSGGTCRVRFNVAPETDGTATLKYYVPGVGWRATGITGIVSGKWYDVSIELTAGKTNATIIFGNKIATVPLEGTGESAVDHFWLGSGGGAPTGEVFYIDDLHVEIPEVKVTYAATFVGGTGAEGTSPAKADVEAGKTVVLPANTFTKTGYEFIGWLYEGKLYRAGENFIMPAKAVEFTAYWMINPYNGGFTENFEGKTEGTTPGTGWWNNSNTDLLHGRVYNDVDNKVLRVLDGGAGTINIARLFDESSTSRISLKFKNISYGTGCNLFGLLEGPFVNYKYKLRLAVMPEADGSGTLKYYKSGWKATGIAGIAPEKWYDVTIELLDGATTATVIFGEQIASVPIEGADTVVSNLWFGSGGGGSYGDTFYVDDISVKTKREPLETYYVSANGTADGDGATLETALNSFETIYKYADVSVYPVVNVYVDGKVSAGDAENKEYKGLTLNILPANASGDEITEFTSVSNVNLGELTIGKLNLSYGVVNNNAATINNLAVDNADEVQFSQLGGSVEAISQNVGTTAEKVVFFVDSDEQIPSVNAVSADVLSIVRAPLMKNDDKTVNFAVTPTDKVSVFETYSGTDYQFGWGKVNYTCYAQNDDVIFYSNADTDYKLTIDEAGDYQLMIVGTESYKPSDSAKETYYFTTKTLTRNGNGWTESVTLPGETNDYFGTKVVLFPLSPDALGWNNDNGTGKITAITAENYAFDGIVYTAKKAHTADFANFVEPAVPEGKYFVGWMNSDGTYSEGTKSLEAGEAITAQLADYDLALEADLSVIGAQIRVNEAAHDLRFVSKVSKSLLNSLGIAESNYYGENVKMGTVLLPSSYLSDDIFGVGYIDTKDNMAAKVPAKKMYGSDETSVTFTAVLTGFKEVNKFYDYVARPYVEYIDKNGITRYVYGDAYDTSVWEIADCALKLDQSGDRPLNEYVKDSIVDIHSNIETYIQAAYDGKTVVRGGAPEFETESTGRHTDVHLAKGNYADATAEQFAHGKVFYNTNFGTLVREIHITGGSVNTEIGVIADARLEHIDYNGTDMYDATYMLYAQTNGVYNNERVDNSLINAAKVAGLYDTTVVAGDVIEYSADASLEFFRNNISDKFDNVISTVSDADGYNSKVVNGVMLVSIDNASGEYTQEQFENFEADVATARANGYTVLVFQNVPLATGDEADTLVKPVENFGENTSGINYYSFGNDLTSDSMYSLITTNSDIIRGIFNTYFGHNSYVEILARDSDGNVDVSAPSIPQFGMASVNCTDNSTNGGKADKGAIVKIVITPAN